MESDFDFSGGASGSWWDGLNQLAGQVLAYKTATAPNAVRWMPYEAGGGPQYGVGANGELISRGLPASTPAAAGLASLLPLALIAAAVFLVVRALK